MKTCLELGKEVYVSIWDRSDITGILDDIIEDQGFDVSEDQYNTLVNNCFKWMDSLDDCNNPPDFNSIQSYLENNL